MLDGPSGVGLILLRLQQKDRLCIFDLCKLKPEDFPESDVRLVLPPPIEHPYGPPAPLPLLQLVIRCTHVRASTDGLFFACGNVRCVHYSGYQVLVECKELKFALGEKEPFFCSLALYHRTKRCVRPALARPAQLTYTTFPPDVASLRRFTSILTPIDSWRWSRYGTR